MFKLTGIQLLSKVSKENKNFQRYQFYSSGRNYDSKTYNQNTQSIVRRRRPYMSYTLGAIIGGLLAYDGITNQFTYCGAGIRFCRSVKTASLIAFDYMLLNEMDEEYERKLKRVHSRSAKRLLRTCLDNGGLYIKVGQGVAAVNHILPKEYTTTLMKLQDSCDFRSQSDVEKVFLEDFGMLPHKVFAKFNYQPKAAASLAQVFKAELPTGEIVAVKVQYSDLQKRFVSDLGTIMFLQNIVELFFKGYNFGWILDNVRNNLIQELDFLQEGQNAELCAQHMKYVKDVHVPKVYWDYSKQRVLTLEWVDGMKISDMEKIEEKNLNVKEIDLKLYEVCATQIFHTGFVHADPHSSNVFVRKNEKTGKPQIVLLDHGLYESVPKDVRMPLCEFWEATVLRNKTQMKATAAKLNVKEYMKFAEVLFQQPIQLETSGIKNKLTQEDIEYMQTVAKENFERIMDTLKEMPRNLLFVVRNLNTIRSIGRLHGDVVDRPKVMARYSQYYLYSDQKSSLRNYLRRITHRLYFEYCLWTISFKLTLINAYFNFLYFVGRAPKSARTILKEVLTVPYEDM